MKEMTLGEFARKFPAFGKAVTEELSYETRQVLAKEVLDFVTAHTPVADAGSFGSGSLSRSPGELRRAWRILRGGRSLRSATSVVNSAPHAKIVDVPHRRLPSGGAVGSPDFPRGMTRPAQQHIESVGNGLVADAARKVDRKLASRIT